MGKKYQSEALEVLHGMAEDLYAIGAINADRMEAYNNNCLVSDFETPSGSAITGKQPPFPAYAKPR